MDLNDFCLIDEHANYAIDQPWRVGKWVYATDGRIMVRCPADDWPAVCVTTAKMPDCEAVIEPMAGVKNWQAVPRKERCITCSGHGGWSFTCDNCDHVHSIVCVHCHVSFMGRMLAQHYVNMIRDLPGAKLGVLRMGDGDAVFFTFDGGVGVLMPRVDVDGPLNGQRHHG